MGRPLLEQMDSTSAFRTGRDGLSALEVVHRHGRQIPDRSLSCADCVDDVCVKDLTLDRPFRMSLCHTGQIGDQGSRFQCLQTGVGSYFQSQLLVLAVEDLRSCAGRRYF